MSNRGGHQSSYCGHQGIPLGHPQHRTFLPPNCGHGGVYPPSRPGVLNQEGLSMPQSIPSNQNQNLASLGIPRIPGQSLIHQSHMHHGSQVAYLTSIPTAYFFIYILNVVHRINT